jgi:SPASM domain peptide maturase of grasp-with-spasm system
MKMCRPDTFAPDKYFLLFSNCIPVKGANRSVIVDVQREEMFFIPNDFYELVKELNQDTYNEVCSAYDEESVEYLNNYIEYLISNELGFWTDTPSFFPAMSLNWDSPSIITNAIVDVKSDSNHPWKKIFNELEDLGCKDIQLRFYDFINPAELSNILDLLDKRRIKSVEIILKFDEVYKKRFALALTKKYLRIRTLYFHSSPKNDVYVMNDGKTALAMGNIVYIKQTISSNEHCGQINPGFFTFGISSFSEAVNFNSCLNRKVSIDYNGDLKNCPTLNKVFGNVNTDLISEVLNSDFTRLWYINKDQINICKDCEFRYVCTDCRGFLDNDFQKPKKCTYDPYISQWLQ